MTPRTPVLIAVFAASLAIAAPASAVPAVTPPGLSTAPGATTRLATKIKHDSAQLSGRIEPGLLLAATYWFESGSTAGYGSATAPLSIAFGPGQIPVTADIDGLLPETTYHFRVMATNLTGTTTGSDWAFTTDPIPAADAPPGTDDIPPGTDDVPPGTDDSPDDEGGDVPEPSLGTDVLTAPERGTILVQEPGHTGFEPLPQGASLPVGSVIDARDGVVALTTELASGGTQRATFWGGVFAVKQRARENGLTELVLRGPAALDCQPTARKKQPLRASRSTRGRRLWGRDNGGRWRTRGRGSHATTRGTAWFMEERCEGTYARVTKGAVAVRDLRTNRTLLLRAGQRHLARVAARR